MSSMCEGSENYFWHLGDKVGSGATSDVFKAYHVSTGKIVAAKVSKVRSAQRITRSTEKRSEAQSIFDREINFLKNIDHDNIVRFIDTEFVKTPADLYALPNREVLFLEFCNGGSVGDILRLPINRYGLSEDIVIQIMKDVTSALKYLHQRKILHRDIKPDNIMQSIDINGKTTFKLTDLGVARQVNPEESTSYSIRGTEEYVHPVVYREVFPDIRVNVKGKPTETRVPFPFEVEMWSFGVTIYQCSTGRMPFQPFEGTRSDRETMRRILTSIPTGMISGTQLENNGEIQWSKFLPKWCRLSLKLKEMLEKLLARLFETNQDLLMKHEEFFIETEKILCLIPIDYLNLKKLTLICTYYQPNDLIKTFFDDIRRENDDDRNINYYCLFQNVHYPIPKDENLTIKQFYEQFPLNPSRDKPLVIYTFSSIKFDQKLTPKIDIPDVQPIRNIQDIFYSNYEWSKNIIGVFFNLKNQLIEYEYIMKIIQSSIIIIHRFLKSNLLKLLSAIRDQLCDYRIVHELEKIVNVIESNEQSSIKSSRYCHKSIVKSFQTNETMSLNEQNLSTIRPILKSATALYKNLMEYDKELTAISDQNFNEQFKVNNDHQTGFNTIHISKQINNYSVHIQRIDKHVNNAIDLSDKFRRDTMIDKPTSLQMTSHILRQKLLENIHEQLIRSINEECYPLILEIFSEYKKLIKQQADINQVLQRIQLLFDDQCKNKISLNEIRQIINNELIKLCMNEKTSLVSDQSDNNDEIAQHQQLSNVFVEENFSYLSNTISFTDYSTTMHKTIKQAEDNANMLNDMIKQLQQQQTKSLKIK